MENQVEGNQPSNASSEILAAKASNKRFKGFLQNKTKLPIVLIVVVLVGLGFLVLFTSFRQPADKRANVCSRDMISEASHNMSSTGYKELEGYTKEIEKLKGYETDPNCLYITLVYHVYSSDPKSSRTALTQLDQAVAKERPIDPELTATVPLKNLRDDVAFLEQIGKSQNNMSTFSAPED